MEMEVDVAYWMCIFRKASLGTGLRWISLVDMTTKPSLAFSLPVDGSGGYDYAASSISASSSLSGASASRSYPSAAPSHRRSTAFVASRLTEVRVLSGGRVPISRTWRSSPKHSTSTSISQIPTRT
ncbi:hypothetical protein GALMADRAFT_411806 [Galerina marginata CBS 339.88]|uniref:Uncharacterized protein n=1 Tax=Galerina marginata (strain CBS 339.88) TaxID=685588 RepID=A0A067T3F8_GALM3|nr:hypothetical protein GALMADRAFT_411806 [Galerina marginata CBS 339.88]